VRGFARRGADEFAFHPRREAIWRAAFATATRGFQIEIISTPNGTRGKYYELAKAAGLVDYVRPVDEKQVPRLRPAASARDDKRGEGTVDRQTGMSAPLQCGEWSEHWVDLASARAQGFKVDVEALRAAIGDDDAWQQEYCCRFLSDAAYFIPPELVVAAESSAATTELLPVAGATGLGKSLGVDIGRKRDLTVLWAVEVENAEAAPEARVYVTRGVRVLERQPLRSSGRCWMRCWRCERNLNSQI
jgi:phage FluMu gp28-like protein